MAEMFLPGRYLTQPGQMISRYEQASDYAFAGAGSSIALNTDAQFIRQGSGSLKVTCNRGSAAPTNVRSTHAISILNPLGRFGWWVYVTDYTLLSTITLAVYSTYNTDFYFQSYSFGDADKQFNGWHWVSLARDQFGGTTGAPDWDAKPFTTVELRFNQAGATQVVCYIDACFAAFKARPKLILWADDGYESWHDLGLPEVESRGLRATHGIIASLIDEATYMTSAELDAIYQRGHDLVVHGATALDAVGDIGADLDENQEFLISNGWTRGAFHYVYPNGVYQLSAGDTTIADALRARGFLTARGTASPRNYNTAYGLGDAGYLLPIIGGQAADAPATLLTRVGQAITRGDNCGVMFHRIVASGASGIEYNTPDLATFLDGVVELVEAGSIDVVTASQWWAGFASPGYGLGLIGGASRSPLHGTVFGGICG